MLLIGCSNKPPIPAGKMKLLIWDLAMVDEYAGYYVKLDTLRNIDSATNTLYYRVLGMHNVTREQFNEANRYYINHPSEYRVLLDSVTNYGNRQRDANYERRYRPQPAEIVLDSIQ